LRELRSLRENWVRFVICRGGAGGSLLGAGAERARLAAVSFDDMADPLPLVTT
jgi:hypothetical protein